MNRISALVASVAKALGKKYNISLSEGTPLSRFGGRRINPERNRQRRLLKSLGGRRQYRKAMRALRSLKHEIIVEVAQNGEAAS